MANVVCGEPMRLDRDGQWLARATYLETRAGLIPIGVEVRPARFGAGWLPLPAELDPSEVPVGGLPLAALRGIEWRDQRVRAEKVATQSVAELSLFDETGEGLREFLRRVTAVAVERGMLRAGRRDLARAFFVLIKASADGSRDGSPPRRGQILDQVRQVFPDVDETEIRATLQWARTHRPPLFTSNGPRRAGGMLTGFAQKVLVLADPTEVLSPDDRDEAFAQRAVDLPEFRR